MSSIITRQKLEGKIGHYRAQVKIPPHLRKIWAFIYNAIAAISKGEANHLRDDAADQLCHDVVKHAKTLLAASDSFREDYVAWLRRNVDPHDEKLRDEVAKFLDETFPTSQLGSSLRRRRFATQENQNENRRTGQRIHGQGRAGNARPSNRSNA